MTGNNPISAIKKVKRKYLFVRGTEVVLWSMAVASLSFFLTKILSGSNLVASIVSVAIALVVAYAAGRRLHLFGLDEKSIALYLNRRYPRLQESTELLLEREEDLSLLQQLQRSQVSRRMEEIYPTIKLPHHIGRASVALFVSIAAGMLTSFLKPQDSSTPIPGFEGIKPIAKQYLPPTIKASVITVSPPAYMRIKRFTSPGFDLQLPEGSTVKWNITFDSPVSSPAIIFSAQDTVLLGSRDLQYIIERTFIKSGFYQLTWKDQDGNSQYTDYYKLDIISDHPPGIQIQRPDQHLELSLRDSRNVNLVATITDDYGLTASTIIATVSRGTGEAIKFREEKFKFDDPVKIEGTQVLATKTLDLAKMGMEPGDELYFYVEAIDNKMPGPNRTRTETYFITIMDTASIQNSMEASLGVDLMPEYFRSQRQIIIDSEKLLRERNRISKQNFNERSNELAHDQKVLRLRYGEFLGEEFESSIGPQNSDDHADTRADIEKEFGHDHDSENEHNLVEDQAGRSPHKHAETSSDNKANVMEGFVHAHDNEEEATFFVQSIRAKLKAAVTIMWDAELYLRLYQPEKSLPYQYRALKLLKEISQDSRIYVHRTGFDPPPLKEDKRLTGDLSDVKNSTSKVETPEKENNYRAIRLAVNSIERLLNVDSIEIEEGPKKILFNAGRELAALELKQPGSYLQTLSLLNDLLQDKVKDSERKNVLMKIRSSLWDALPTESPSPSAESGVVHQLDREFLKHLEPFQ